MNADSESNPCPTATAVAVDELLGLQPGDVERVYRRAKLRGGPDAFRTATALEWLRRLIELEASRMGQPLLPAAHRPVHLPLAEPPVKATPADLAEQERQRAAHTRTQQQFENQRRGFPTTTASADQPENPPVTPYEQALERDSKRQMVRATS